MSTPHIGAPDGAFAKTVLMPGDPLRAKFIAENFLEDAKLVTDIRNMLGYTGKYKGHDVSVMASGMGTPSIGIYSYELFKFYDVDEIIRVGSAGGYVPELKLYDVVLADSVFSESAYARLNSGKEVSDTLYPSEKLNSRLEETANRLGIPIHKGRIYTSDTFYRQNMDYMTFVRDEKKCLAVEMESYALFHNANVLNKDAACLLTISDSFAFPEETTPQEREKSFTHMVDIALESLIR